MDITAQLDQLTTADKIRTMEYLWDDLCRHADEVPSPAWYAETLSQREQGAARYSVIGKTRKQEFANC